MASQNGGENSTDASPTLTDRITAAVLRTCRLVDGNAALSTCTRDHNGRTLVKMTSGSGHTATELAAALRAMMPLASVSTEQDLLSGEVAATVSVPTAMDEWDLAHRRARESQFSKFLRAAMFSLLVMAAGAWIAHVHDIVQETGTGATTDADANRSEL